MDILTNAQSPLQFKNEFDVLKHHKIEDWTKPSKVASPMSVSDGNTKSSEHRHLRKQSSSPLPESDPSKPEKSKSLSDRRFTISSYHSHLSSKMTSKPKHPLAGNISKSATSPIKTQLSQKLSQQSEAMHGKLSKSKSTSGVLSTGSVSSSDDSQSDNGLNDRDVDDYLYNLPTYSEDAIEILSAELENQLREAKLKHLACTEVLLPCDLLNRISVDMLDMADSEPCGIRGCNIIIEFEDEPNNTRQIASMKVDQNTVSTFELYLTIKHDRSGWTSILPQFLKNLTRGGTIMISREYSLVKNKLYYFFSD